MVQPELVLFDLDNTLTDRMYSLTVYTQEFARAFSGKLVPVDEDYLFQIIKKADSGGYKPKKDMAKVLINELDWILTPDLDEICNHWYKHFPLSVQGRDGLADMLNYLELQGIPRGVVTNGRTRSQNKKIDTLGIREKMECIVISDDIGIKKPDSKIFEFAMSKFKGIATGNAWYIGDDPYRDIVGAGKAGLVTVWFRTGTSWPTQYPRPRYKVDTMWELVRMVDQALDCKCELSTT